MTQEPKVAITMKSTVSSRISSPLQSLFDSSGSTKGSVNEVIDSAPQHLGSARPIPEPSINVRLNPRLATPYPLVSSFPPVVAISSISSHTSTFSSNRLQSGNSSPKFLCSKMWRRLAFSNRSLGQIGFGDSPYSQSEDSRPAPRNAF